MEIVEPILLYIVMVLGLGWFVGRMCGLTGKYESRIKKAEEVKRD